MRFITFETLGTGVRAFECAFSMRTSSFVHGLMTRRAVFAFAVLADFVPLTVFFKALGIIQILHLDAAQIGMRCGDKKAGSLTYSILSDNWYVRVPASWSMLRRKHTWAQAIEDGATLAARLKNIAFDVPRAPQAYVALRKPRATILQEGPQVFLRASICVMDPTNTRGIENWSVDPEDGSFKSSHGHSLLRSSAHHIKSEAVVVESDLRAKS